jgi:hypothetical protein
MNLIDAPLSLIWVAGGTARLATELLVFQVLNRGLGRKNGVLSEYFARMYQSIVGIFR